MVLRLDGGWSYIKESLLHEFPALSMAGGFELLRTDGPYSRTLVEIGTSHLAGVSKLKQFVDQARVYIRPLQTDLPLDEADSDTILVGDKMNATGLLVMYEGY